MSDHDQVKMTKMNYANDRPKAKNPLKVEDLTFRDGHQSLFATRGRTEDMIPVAEMMDQVGFWAMEVWGGACFDVPTRFLNEDHNSTRLLMGDCFRCHGMHFQGGIEDLVEPVSINGPWTLKREELAEKLKELQLGVRTEMVEKVTVDKDWFKGI